ncbi:peroxiredoxin [Ammoniphilus sp. YIM 78166]|uniref:peroxiredoxin family protein n=1 Tax=Ammoniphilus sp. YIM 78166 TaxID=1644106 RepID=UPI00106F28E4|nr:TlpA disulfide reductase family protein [Ammoniphilus sp. YIM 78166]
MIKNMIAIAALIGLVIWGVYDTGKKDLGLESGQSDAQGEIKQEKVNAPVGIQKGNLAPDFELKALDGESIKLSDYRGKRIVLNMWATWCPPCRAEMPDMQDFYEANQDKGFIILGVNLTSSEKQPENIAKFIDEFGLTFPVVLDEENSVADRYQVVSIPTSYMIDSRGVIQQKIIGPMNKEMMEELVFGME